VTKSLIDLRPYFNLTNENRINMPTTLYYDEFDLIDAWDYLIEAFN
jgi:hypothetical protein